MRPHACCGGRQGGAAGFIVVAVLWILGALAMLVSIYAVFVTNTAAGLDVNDDRLQAEASMSAALELTAHQLAAAEAKSRPTSGSFTFAIGRSTVTADFRSEAARIDLNAAPKPLLAGLFAGLGAKTPEAEYYADRIIGWRTEAPATGQQNPATEQQNQATGQQNDEAATYRTAGIGYAPRQGPFASVDELWLVLGLPPILVERALPHVTVFSGRPEINILDAQPEVLAALPGMTPDRLYGILAQRGAGPANAELVLGLLGPARAAATVEGSKAIRVAARIRFGNGRQVGSEAVILTLDDAAEPFRVLSWHDDFDGARRADQR
ncbi:MAG: type II secretion system protein GspK [Xanthobacteraceae bacterium]